MKTSLAEKNSANPGEKAPRKPLPKKKKILIGAIAVACLAALGLTLPKLLTKKQDTGTDIRTTVLQKQTLTEAITLSGTVSCPSVVNVTASGTEKVKEIKVKIGQQVKVGDVLFQMDTADIDKELAKIGTNSAQAIKDAQEIYDSALAAKKTADDLLTSVQNRYNTEKQKSVQAYAPYKRALDFQRRCAERL